MKTEEVGKDMGDQSWKEVKRENIEKARLGTELGETVKFIGQPSRRAKLFQAEGEYLRCLQGSKQMELVGRPITQSGEGRVNAGGPHQTTQFFKKKLLFMVVLIRRCKGSIRHAG